MGISDGLQGSMDEADCSVGTIVWVRRRNGSWWPGRILGPDELSSSHLMSPRSGTPVKLLGREDASVDWYNLEKSKRVKAFRCGEFDDCIERAETSQRNPIKKREKYARREDAILHALELEKQQMEKKQLKLGVGVNSLSSNMPSVSKKDLGIPGNHANAHSKSLNLKSHTISKKLDSSLEEKSMGNSLYARKSKHLKQAILKDPEAVAAVPRMRGLQDFGLKISPTKRNHSQSVTSEGSGKPLPVDNHVNELPTVVQSTGREDHDSTIKNLLDMKRKRAHVGAAEESPCKRRDRRRPLVKVLQSSAKLLNSQSLQYGDCVSISTQREKEQTGELCRSIRKPCVDLPAELNDSLEHAGVPVDKMQGLKSPFGSYSGRVNPSSSAEENCSSGLVKDKSSDVSEREYLDQGMDEVTTPTVSNAVGPRNSGTFVTGNYHFKAKAGSMSSEELDEQHSYDQTAIGSADVGSSKWQLKGKRNVRNLTKRSMDLMDQYNSNGLIHGTYLEGRRNTLNQRVFQEGFNHEGEEFENGFDGDDLIGNDPMQSHIWGFNNRRHPLTFEAVRKDRGRYRPHIFNSERIWEADGLSQVSLRRYWDESSERFDPVYGGHCLDDSMESWLVDVDLKVQSSYQGEHVPLVSLMSRLNGKAIVGHPIQIETLEDGSTDLFTNEDFRDEEPTAGNNGGTTPVPPVWRTARRTVMHRVPRPNPSSSSSALDDDRAEVANLESKLPLYKKSYSRHSSNHKTKLTRKSISNINRKKKIPDKLLEIVTVSSQKTRTLSSIAVEQKHSGKATFDPKLASKSRSIVDGLIKTDEVGPTIVTCIPVKLVFSRLMEAVGRPPSSRADRHVHSV